MFLLDRVCPKPRRTVRVEPSCNEPFSWNASLRFEMAGYFALKLAYSPAARTADFVCLPGSSGKDFKVSGPTVGIFPTLQTNLAVGSDCELSHPVNNFDSQT